MSRPNGRGKGPDYYDPEGRRYGIPTFPFRFAPEGFLTRRQLRVRGLAPGGQEVKAQILWRHQRQVRVAYLHSEALARPKRTPTPAQLAAVGKALAARKTCQSCGETKPYYIPVSLGECPDCARDARRQPEPGPDREAA